MARIGLRLLCAVLSLAALAASAQAQELRIYQIDVEQGDATLIVSPEGHALLFDAGPNGAGAGRVIPRLEALGVSGLDYTVVSHYDADHIGGLDEVLNGGDRKSTRLNSSHSRASRMPSSA